MVAFEPTFSVIDGSLTIRLMLGLLLMTAAEATGEDSAALTDALLVAGRGAIAMTPTLRVQEGAR